MKANPPTLHRSQVERVFRELADEYLASRSETEKERAWRRISSRRIPSRQGALSANSVAASWLGVSWAGARWFRWVALLGAPALAAAATVVWLLQQPASLDFAVDGSAHANAGLVRTAKQPATLNFSDGSQLDLQPETEVSVQVVDKHRAVNRLRSGRLHAQVQHERETDWRFLAGPFEVHVVGTEFDIGWSPKTGTLSVVMQAGEVQINGPGREQHTLRAGESLQVSDRAATQTASAAPVVPEALPETEEPEADDDQSQPQVRKPAPVAAEEEDDSAREEQVVEEKLDWADLVAEGKFTEVVWDAKKTGFEAAIQSASRSNLQALAQAAHYTGNAALAVRAYKAMRQRFGASSEGQQAAFFLGRLYDQQGNSANALRWLETYSREAPSGVYASEALGRRITLAHRLRGKQAAQSLAKQYLRQFPKGTYATTARDILRAK